MKRPTVMKVDRSGMTTTGMTPRTPLATFQLDDPPGDEAAEEAGDEAAEEAGAHGRGDRAADDAGHESGAVGDGEGDEAGEDRHEEAEGRTADDEEQRGPRRQAEGAEVLGDVVLVGRGQVVLDDLDRALLRRGRPGRA